MRRSLKDFDFFLLAAVCALVIFGILMIGSATQRHMTDEAPRQVIWFVLGLALLFAAALIDYHFICRFYIPIYILCIVLLVTVLAYNRLRGETVARWFSVGPANIQPSEFAKIFMIVFISTFIHKKKEAINEPRVLLAALALIALPAALVMIQPSLSASIVLVVVPMAILFAGGVSMRYVAPAALLLIPAGILFYVDLISGAPVFVDKILGEYQMGRLLTFFSPVENSDERFQTNQSIQAIGSGQFGGKGLYNGQIIQHSNLPEAHNDFIFSVIGEEWGFIGCMAVLAVMLFIIVKCLLAAHRAADKLGQLLATGVAVMYAFQVFVNVGVATGLLPNTGMPFPFVSYGGSSLWINMAAAGLVISVGMTKNKSIFEG